MTGLMPSRRGQWFCTMLNQAGTDMATRAVTYRMSSKLVGFIPRGKLQASISGVAHNA